MFTAGADNSISCVYKEYGCLSSGDDVASGGGSGSGVDYFAAGGVSAESIVTASGDDTRTPRYSQRPTW
jgi:hypothetical protein